LPKDAGAFDRYFAEMLGPDGPVHPTDTARELARFVLRPRLGALIPVLGWLPPATYSWLQWPSIALLPADLRAEFEIPWGTRQAAVSAWLSTGLRAGRLLVPERLRWFPASVRAYDRVSGARE